ncbi:hypothetical protein FB561_2955 [Kribbella amoyensis]|uniref:Uncharacterized protein n=2 Tax=Kribbella amoyensis TaxID=996641 RepID=A0A561BSP9_9ACTN|nr:hypothetical protein FB561_2955 [Kribbella amoyensis]
MFLPDLRYNTYVAFVEGCNSATEGVLLEGFGDWVHARILGVQTSFHWSAVVASPYLSHRLDESWQHSPKVDEFDAAASAELLAQLDAFLADRST